MDKIELKVTIEPERLDALRYFLSAKEKRTPEKELQRLLEELYEKYVPADTREYLDSKNKPAVRPRPRRTAKGGRTAQTQDNNSDQDNPGQDVSTGYDMGGRHDEKVRFFELGSSFVQSAVESSPSQRYPLPRTQYLQ